MDALHPTFIENEMNRRYLLEGAGMQRAQLNMPCTPRRSAAYPKLADHYKVAHLMTTNDIVDMSVSHHIESARDGCWKVYKIQADHPSLRSTTVFVNTRTNVTQTGEPFDLRCRRSRESFREEKWSIMAKYLPKASVITRHNIKLLCDTNGGLTTIILCWTGTLAMIISTTT